MATRSTIGIKLPGGQVQSIYCHWDGYTSHNGAILLEHYQDRRKVEKLIGLGNLSILGPNIGEKHLFDNPHPYGSPEHEAWDHEMRDSCTFYGRDRGESDSHARLHENEIDFLKSGEEYDYLFDNGVWYVSDHGSSLKPLHIVLEMEEDDA